MERDATWNEKGEPMIRSTKLLPAICVTLGLALPASIAPAAAKGCLKGAVVGGVAGHFAGRHGVLGAAAGCAIGHHRASRQQAGKEQAQQPRKAGTDIR
jgi:hypothetical protein